MKDQLIEKSRQTEVIAHIAEKNLRKLFPDEHIQERRRVFLPDGTFEDLHYAGEAWSKKEKIFSEVLDAAGYEWRIVTETKQYLGYIKLDGKDYPVRSVSDRKTAIKVSTNLPEKEHYEKVDELVKHLAENDVAVLDGECQITVTTRC